MRLVRLAHDSWINSSLVEMIKITSEHHEEDPSRWFIDVVMVDGSKRVFGPFDTREEVEDYATTFVNMVNGEPPSDEMLAMARQAVKEYVTQANIDVKAWAALLAKDTKHHE
jgi:hypothetical protein